MSLKEIAYALKIYYSNAEEAEKIIMERALLAAGASAVAGFVPILELPAMIVACVGAVWSMYISLCKCLNVPLKDNFLKVLASAALSNIATNLIGVFAVEIIVAVVPGVGSVAGAAVTFACVYLAGLMFMKMLLALAKKGKTGANVGTVSERELKSTIKQQTPSKSDVKDARDIFDRNYEK